MSEAWTRGGNARREEMFLRAYAGEGARREAVEPGAARAPAELAGCIDHTLLKPEATREQVETLCREAMQHGFAAVCVNPRFVPLCAQVLQDSEVAIATVAGFPLGASDTEIKALEARRAVQLGATEIDMVLPVGALKGGRHDAVFRDVAAVRRETMGVAVLKVILECVLLTPQEMELAARICADAGADFVKTSTGFAGGGATVEDVRRLRQVVGGTVGVKASGGIRDRAAAEAMLAAGANRLGTSSGVAIVSG
jgi:deoxyribose-phosphate aldolase